MSTTGSRGVNIGSTHGMSIRPSNFRELARLGETLRGMLRNPTVSQSGPR